MEQKFIITKEGNLRMGVVHMHRDLLKYGDECLGGGYYQFDFVSNTLVLDRESYDFGEPRWQELVDKGMPLRVSSDYKGMRIVYRPENEYQKDFEVSLNLQILYED